MGYSDHLNYKCAIFPVSFLLDGAVAADLWNLKVCMNSGSDHNGIFVAAAADKATDSYE